LSDASKRYTEREFSLILSKAAELAGSSNSIGAVTDGLTLEEITSIAEEAGLDAESIARAARLIPDHDHASVLRRVMGGALRVQRGIDLPGELTNERAQRILNLARRATQTRGVGDADTTGVSWSTRGVFVSAHGEAGATRVHVSVNHRAWLIVPIWLGGIGVVATLYTAVAAGDSGFANPYLVLAGGWGITAGVAWSALRRKTRETRATLERLIEAIGESFDRERAR
jgi:hypothetical protein